MKGIVWSKAVKLLVIYPSSAENFLRLTGHWLSKGAYLRFDVRSVVCCSCLGCCGGWAGLVQEEHGGCDAVSGFVSENSRISVFFFH